MVSVKYDFLIKPQLSFSDMKETQRCKNQWSQCRSERILLEPSTWPLVSMRDSCSLWQRRLHVLWLTASTSDSQSSSSPSSSLSGKAVSDEQCGMPAISTLPVCRIRNLHTWVSRGEWVSSVLRPHQHSIGYTGDGFYRSKDPTNSITVLKEMLQKTKKTTKTTKRTYT